jgi:hypothetical protein
MMPVSIEPHSKKGQQIVHKCVKCGFERKNMTANDDELDAILEIMRRQPSSRA